MHVMLRATRRAGAKFRGGAAAGACLMELKPNIGVLVRLKKESQAANSPFVEPQERWEGARSLPSACSRAFSRAALIAVSTADSARW